MDGWNCIVTLSNGNFSVKSIIQKYHAMPIFCLLLVLVFLYFPVLFLGRTLQSPEMARMNVNLKAPPSPQAILHTQVAPQIFNTEQVTATNERFPYDIYLGKIVRSLQFPLWNSHQGIGFPFAAQYETSAFFPLRIIQVLFPPSTRDWFFIFHIWLAGIFTYLFFFRSGLNRISSFWGATLYMGSGVFSWFMQLQDYMSVAMMLPLVMLATYHLSNKISGRNIAFLGIVTGCILLAGQPEAIFFALVLCGSFYLFRLFSSDVGRNLRIKNAMGYAAGNLLGFFIASPLLLLFLQLMQLSFSIHSSTPHDNNLIFGLAGRTKLYQLPAILFPKLLDFPIMPATVPDAASWDFLGGYLGILPFFFLIAGCFVQNKKLKKQFLFFLFFGIFFILMDLGVWPFGWVGYLPFFRQAWSPRWGGAAWSFALISAATYGFYFLQTVNYSNAEWNACIKKVFLLIIGVTYLCFAVDMGYSDASNIFVVNNFFQPLVIDMVNFIFGVACFLLLVYILKYYRHTGRCWTACSILLILSLWYWLSKGDLQLLYFYEKLSVVDNLLLTKSVSIILGLLFLLSVLLYVNGRDKSFLISIVIIFSIATIENMHVFPGYPKYQAVESETPFIDFLKEKSGENRLFASNGILTPSYASVYGLYDIRFLNALSINSYQYFVEEYIKEQKYYNYKNWFDANYFLNKPIIENDQYIVHFRNSFTKAIDLLGVKYLITSKKQNIEWIKKTYPNWIPQLKLVYTDKFVNIYENLTSMPRVFLVSHYLYASSYEDAQKIAMSDGVNLKSTVVLEKPIAIGLKTNHSIPGEVKIASYQDNEVVIHSNTKEQAMLVLTDGYYPGWNALIDGKKTEIYRVNGLVRGVIVPAGSHEVKYYYFPMIFKLGLACAIVSLIVCIVLMLI